MVLQRLWIDLLTYGEYSTSHVSCIHTCCSNIKSCLFEAISLQGKRIKLKLWDGVTLYIAVSKIARIQGVYYLIFLSSYKPRGIFCHNSFVNYQIHNNRLKVHIALVIWMPS